MSDPATIIANEARLREQFILIGKLTVKVDLSAQLAGMAASLNASAMQAALVGINSAARAELADARTALTALVEGVGPGVTADFGAYSAIDQVLRVERFAGKSACVDFVKAHPACTEAEAVAAWGAGGMVATGLQVLLQDPAALGQVYRTNLLAQGLTPDTTWESQRVWLVATPKTIIMGA